ncbi:MAG: hypothetical protein Q8919_15105, partial [Bacteroidota bacterium]|nr:hypothetical protein [Bacteroidota bacterium]
MKRVILIIPLVALLVTDSFSQWSVVGNKLFGPHTTPYGGVITFNDGIVWAGLNHLVNSLDSGTTWNSIADPLQGSQLSEICFLNKDTGAIACIDKGIFLTNDGGKTWRHILTVSECFGLSFARNGNEMFVAERAGLVGTVHYTSDGGLTWTDQQVEGSGGGAYDAAYNPKTGKAYVLSRYISPTRASHINISSDFGKTWQRQVGNVDLDCYSFALDSCDPNKIYLGNEEFDESANNLSEIFVSADEGRSWSSKAQGPDGFFSAAFSSASNAIYTASALGQGIFRSLDRGTTWKSIGGPSPREDTRLLCAINNNIVLAADQQGNVWRTL